MARLRLLVALLCMVIILGGCIDIYEHIGKERNGNVNVYLKLTVSKALLKMAESESDSESDPFGEIFAEGNEFTNEITNLKGTLAKVDTELETGLAMQLSLNVKAPEIHTALQSGEAPFLPKFGNDRITLSFSGMSRNTDSSSEDSAMGLVLMSSYKYRLSISKSACSTISRVVYSTDEVDYKPQVIDLPDMFLIEVPLSYLMKTSKVSELVIYR